MVASDAGITSATAIGWTAHAGISERGGGSSRHRAQDVNDSSRGRKIENVARFMGNHSGVSCVVGNSRGALALVPLELAYRPVEPFHLARERDHRLLRPFAASRLNRTIRPQDRQRRDHEGEQSADSEQSTAPGPSGEVGADEGNSHDGVSGDTGTHPFKIGSETTTMTVRPQTRHAEHNDPEWLKTAYSEIGTKEIRGVDHHPRILDYHACTGLGATDDETPWCASFVCWVLAQSKIASTRSASSLSYLRWGRELKAPVRGCVVVFERVDSEGRVIPNRGHVGFWVGERGNLTCVLGGNQRNQVGVNLYPTARVIGYRWPSLPHNSTTNMASTGVAAGTVVASAPTVLGLIGTLGASKTEVSEVVETARTVSEGLGVSVLAIAGLVVALAGAIYIIRERNKKIREFGI